MDKDKQSSPDRRARQLEHGKARPSQNNPDGYPDEPATTERKAWLVKWKNKDTTTYYDEPPPPTASMESVTPIHTPDQCSAGTGGESREQMLDRFKAAARAVSNGSGGDIRRFYECASDDDLRAALATFRSPDAAATPSEPVKGLLPFAFTYKNYRGEVATRVVTPISVRFGTTEWHPDPQWLMKAFDHEKQAEREFAMADIGTGGAAQPTWQPIETAPRNATEILLLVPRGGKGWPTQRAVVGHWADGGGDEQPRFRGWFYDTGYGYNDLGEPTHWAPLQLKIPERGGAITSTEGKCRGEG